MEPEMKAYFKVLVAAWLTAMFFFYAGLPDMLMFIAIGLVANIVIVYEAKNWDNGKVSPM